MIVLWTRKPFLKWYCTCNNDNKDESIPAFFRANAGSSQNRLPVYQRITHSLSIDNLELPIHFWSMILNRGRKSKPKLANSTQVNQSMMKKKHFLIRHHTLFLNPLPVLSTSDFIYTWNISGNLDGSSS